MKTEYSAEDYPFLVNEIMQHIEHVKKQDPGAALLDIIFDFSFRNNLDVELVGDAINADVYFKSFIHKDCELHRIFRTETKAMENW
jgi:hypothetical protein